MSWVIAVLFAVNVLIGAGAVIEQAKETQEAIAEASPAELREMQKVKARF